MAKIDDANVTSKYNNHTFTLKEINMWLEDSGACIMLNTDSAGKLISAQVLTVDGFPAVVRRMPGFDKPTVERFEETDQQ